jgi:hypothetical protein
MNTAICKAIKKKAVIQFRYHEDLRTVEPQCHGISTAGKEVLRGFQIKNHGKPSESATNRLFEVSKISDLKETGELFLKPGPHYNPNDKAMAYVHCCLEQNKTTKSGRSNVIVSLSKELIREAKDMAVDQQISLSSILADALEQRVRSFKKRKQAARRQKNLMRRGLNLGTRGKATWTRDELHARRIYRH